MQPEASSVLPALTYLMRASSQGSCKTYPTTVLSDISNQESIHQFLDFSSCPTKMDNNYSELMINNITILEINISINIRKKKKLMNLF